MPKKKGSAPRQEGAKTPAKASNDAKTPAKASNDARKSGAKKSAGKKEAGAPSMEVSSPGKSTGGHDRTKWAGSATMGVAPAPEVLPLPKFLARGEPAADDNYLINEKLKMLAGGLPAGPPAVPPHAQPALVVPRNYDPDAPAPADLAAAAVPRNYDPDASVPAASDGVPRNYNSSGELPAALSAVGLAAAGW